MSFMLEINVYNKLNIIETNVEILFLVKLFGGMLNSQPYIILYMTDIWFTVKTSTGIISWSENVPAGLTSAAVFLNQSH